MLQPASTLWVPEAAAVSNPGLSAAVSHPEIPLKPHRVHEPPALSSPEPLAAPSHADNRKRFSRYRRQVHIPPCHRRR